MADDTALLPCDLAQNSISTSEIVLAYADVLRAIEHLVSIGYVIFGWEGWIETKEKQHTHSGQHQGTREFWRPKGENNQQYIESAANFARSTIEQAQRQWDENPEISEATLYFCLSIKLPMGYPN